MKNKNIRAFSSPAAKSLLKNILAASSLAALTLGASNAFAANHDTDNANNTIDNAGIMSGGGWGGNFAVNDSVTFNVDNNKVTNEFNTTIAFIDFNAKNNAIWWQNADGTIGELKGAGGGTFSLKDGKKVDITKVDNNTIIITDQGGAAAEFIFGNEDQTFDKITLKNAASEVSFQATAGDRTVTGTIDGSGANEGKLTYKADAGHTLTQASKIGNTVAVAEVNTAGAGSVVFGATVKSIAIKAGALETTFEGAVTGNVTIVDAKKATFKAGVTGIVDGDVADGKGIAIYDTAGGAINQTGIVGGVKILSKLTTTGANKVTFSNAVKAHNIQLGTNVDFQDNVDTTLNGNVGEIKFTADTI